MNCWDTDQEQNNLWLLTPENDEWNNLWLLSPEEYAEVPTGTVLLSIDGRHAVKGKDSISDDTRFGVLAYGLTPNMAESQGLMPKFIIWKLQS